jgi:hypothetical protein
MKHITSAILASAVCGLLIAGVSPANAAGCLKGAAVGGIAGHMAGHAVLGAAGGCAVGHHMASKADKNAAEQQSRQDANPSYDRNHP